MFGSLSERLVQATRNLSGRGRLSEENIKDSLRFSYTGNRCMVSV